MPEIISQYNHLELDCIFDEYRLYHMDCQLEADYQFPTTLIMIFNWQFAKNIQNFEQKFKIMVTRLTKASFQLTLSGSFLDLQRCHIPILLLNEDWRRHPKEPNNKRKRNDQSIHITSPFSHIRIFTMLKKQSLQYVSSMYLTVIHMGLTWLHKIKMPPPSTFESLSWYIFSLPWSQNMVIQLKFQKGRKCLFLIWRLTRTQPIE